MDRGKRALALPGALVVCLLVSAAEAPPAKGPARFEGKDTLLRPEGYREWVFVGSSVGLEYEPEPGDKKAPRVEEIKHVYINPEAYRAFQKTGEFPEGTVTVLEVFRKAEKHEKGLQGSFADARVGLAASVKDSRRFEGGWGYYSFGGRDAPPKAKASPFPERACWSCHHEKADTDHVFTQFYPILRDAVPKKK